MPVWRQKWTRDNGSERTRPIEVSRAARSAPWPGGSSWSGGPAYWRGV
jgi:hypothetical protein